MIDRRELLASASALVLLGFAPAEAQTAPAETDWTHYANDLASTRYSPLDQINAANFDKLELAWRFSTNALGPRLDADFMSTPLVVNGRLYTTAGFRRDVVCLDAGTGELLWMHTYDEGERIGSARRSGPGRRLLDRRHQRARRLCHPRLHHVLAGRQDRHARSRISAPMAWSTCARMTTRTMDPNRGVIGLHAPPLVVQRHHRGGRGPDAVLQGLCARLRRQDRPAQMDLPHHPAQGRVRLRHLDHAGPGGSQPAIPAPGRRCRPIPSWAWSMCRSNCRRPTCWASPAPARNLFGETLVALDIETGTAQVALPDDPSRPVGPRHLLRRHPLRHPA